MPYLTLTIDCLPVDLPPDAQVALSYRANDLRTLGSREGSFSESFTLPKTARNAAVLGSPHVLDSQSTAPYRLLPAVLTAPGGTELLRGFAVLERAGQGYEVTLTDALGGLFNAVGDRGLRALDLREYDHPYSLATSLIAQARPYTAGFTYALADDGRLFERGPAEGILWHELTAAVYYHAVLTAIVAQALPGYRLTGTLLDEPLYQTAVLPRATPTPQLRESVRTPYAVQVLTQVARTERSPNGGTAYPLLPFPQRIEGPPAAWTTDTEYHTPPFPADIRVTARLLIRLDATNVTGTVGRTVAAVRIVDSADTTDRYVQEQVLLDKSPTLFRAYTTDQPAGYRALDFDFTLPNHPANRRIAVQYRLENGAGLVLGPGSSMRLSIGERTWPAAPVHLDASLPEVSQSDWLALLVNQFNAVVQADAATKTVRFDLFNDLERNRRRFVDWSEKVDFTTAPDLTFVLGEYGQQNTFAYDQAPDTYDALLLGAPTELATGRGTLPVPNATLPRTAEAYAAAFVLPLPRATMKGGASLLWLPFFANPDPAAVPQFYQAAKSYLGTDAPALYGGQVWQCLLAFNLRTEPGTPPRLGPVPCRQMNVPTTAVAWKLVPAAATTADLPTVARMVPLPALPGLRVMEDAPGTAGFIPSWALTRDGLPFDDLLPTYHEGLRRLLDRARVLTMPLRLSPVDIAALDFVRPVWLDIPHVPGYGQVRGLFYLNHIDQYRPDSPGPVPVELVALGDAVPGLAAPALLPVFNPVAVARALLLETGEPFLLETGEPLLLS